MPTPTPARVANAFQKLHTKLGGYSKTVSFVKFGISQESDWSPLTHEADEITELAYPAIVKDTPDESLLAHFQGGIGRDQKIFIILAHSIVEKLPFDTLSARVEQFLGERTGADKGGIYEGDNLYTIESFFAKTTIGRISPQYVVLATAVKHPS
jgi:hypothetical protein